jgi:hypothetical protein
VARVKQMQRQNRLQDGFSTLHDHSISQTVHWVRYCFYFVSSPACLCLLTSGRPLFVFCCSIDFTLGPVPNGDAQGERGFGKKSQKQK